jgi:small GTP-binding protein
MYREKFKKNVKQELKKLNREQVVHFAWRCAVRALPFLGSDGSFGFWNKKARQKHIYSIFYVLDISAIPFNTADGSTADITEAANDAHDGGSRGAFYFAIGSAVYAARTASAYAAETSEYNFISSAVDTAAAAISAAGAEINVDLESIILRDLDTIQNKEGGERKHKLTDLYGEIWDNFQKKLEAEGCAYWGQLYQSIFDSGFVLDTEALERRINVPKEIRRQGAAVVANYLEELEKGAMRLNEARIIILGDKGAGKTCIARRLINPEAPMTTDDESTAGVNTMLWKLEHENINVRIWDFAGHTVTHAVHQFFLSERCLYIMVYDGRTEERNRLEYWLNHMKNYGGNSKAIILVNKRDQHSVDIPINSLKEQYPIEGFYTFSILDDKIDLKTFRNDVAVYIKNNPSWEKQEIPTNYYHVKDELEALFAKGEKEKGQEHITKDEFDEIAVRYDVENIEDLLKDLHFLGVSLWYKDMEEFDTLVLNPEWISHGVYKIINWVNEEKSHSLTLHDFVTVFKEDKDRYPKKQHKFLFKLMKHYELAYETKGGKELIIPHLLKEDRLKELPDFPVGESLMLRYKAEQPLPPNTISRFIIRHNQEIKKEKQRYLVWRYGVVLNDSNSSIALVREEERTISVSVKGPDKTNYISTLRETLNDIFNTYKSEKPELQYRIERFGQIPNEVEAKHPVWLPDRKILNQSNDDIPYYEDITGQHIDLHYTVKNYNITAENLMLEGREN